jgi:SH3-like domain-containing protein
MPGPGEQAQKAPRRSARERAKLAAGLPAGREILGRNARVSGWRGAVAAAGAAFAAALPAAPGCAQPASATGATGLPLPRYVSLKTDRVNLRAGPGAEYPTVWVYKRAGLPVEITQEFEAWRQVRDSGGATGWVLASLVSGRRTAQVLPWEIKEGAAPPRAAIFSSDSARSREVAIVEAGVIANILTCDGRWCSVAVPPYRGYIEQAKLWGVYPGESLK